jgi:hypothetical protein
MGNLKPGATYIYEKYKGVTYAREMHADPSTRFPIGWDYQAEAIEEIDMWKQIHQVAKTNPALQDALNRVIMIYRLSQES